MAFSKLCPTICLIILFANLVYSKENLKIVTIRDTDDLVTFNSLKQIWDEISTNTPGFDITDTDVVVNRSDASLALNQFCGASAEGIQFVLDFSLDPLEDIRKKTMENSIPYIRVDVSLKPYIRVIQSFIRYMNGTDAVIIVTTARELDETLFQLIEKSEFRSIILDKIEPNELKLLHDLRPIPSHIFVIGSTSNLNDMTDKLLQFKSMERRPRSWNFFFTDFNFLDYKYLGINEYANYFFPNKNICCKLMNLKNNCQCNTETNIQLIALHFVIREIINFLVNENIPLKSIDCEQNNTIADELISEISYNDLKFTSSDAFEWKDDSVEFLPSYTIERAEHPEDLEQIAEVDKRNLTLFPDAELTYKRFFRIGIAYAIPWTYPKTDPRTKQTVLNEKGQPVWEGYCIELIARMSEIMDFDYELVYPKEDNFGRRLKGKWTGIVGDLVTGDTDIAVSALKMTAEREEVIDFVAPYFDQTGISIVIRKAVRKTSLFKFMTVLRIEVWMSILGALTATALLVWLLDKYSPYSARNNQEVYTYPVRHFTLKESFWFALTSFTPQGGGEAPKAPSGRILVAAYWLFVVLMLATFTANLAAFLTVERMQTPVQSLEQLARQSRINYTVVEGSDTHQYFINMKFAEDTLYRMWKEITLNSTSDEIQYRVWDYPIKEQYGHILLAINTSIPVKNAAEGFYQVNIHENADFAFIHDSAEIKYEISRNCNLTEVGEVFAEQPYAIAIQQGSHLQDEISRIILDLQKERFFELLSAKYWNNSAKGVCPNSDDNEGISLESLGGVFIATLFGLALAMVTLVGEVIYYRRKERKSNQVVEVKPIMQPNLENTNKENEKKKMGPLKLFTSKMDNRVTIGDQFVPSSQSLNKLSIDKPRLRF